MEAIVTGAAGFIGSHLAEALLAAGHRVRGIDRLSDSYDVGRKRANLERLERHGAFESVTADLNRLDLASELAGADVVFHLAAQPGVRGGWGREFGIYLDDNVLATQRLLEAARQAGVGRVVFASSSTVYGDAERVPTSEDAPAQPISPYGVTKLAAEHLCRLYTRQHDLEVITLRYFTVFGPGQRPDMAFARFIEAALAGRPIEVFGDGSQRRDFTYVSDAVAATLAAALRGVPGEVYNVAGGTQASVREAIATLESLLGHPLEVVHAKPASGDVLHTHADVTKALRALGYAPRTSLPEGLRAQLDATRALAGLSG